MTVESVPDAEKPVDGIPTLSDADRLQGTAIAANGSFKGIPMLDLTREDAGETHRCADHEPKTPVTSIHVRNGPENPNKAV